MQQVYRGMKILTANAGRHLAGPICSNLKNFCDGVCESVVSTFKDGEIKIQIKEDIRGYDVYIVNSLPPPFENIAEMILLADAARRASAGRITLVISYLGYNRQDRKDRQRVPLSALIIAQMLITPQVDQVLILDPHSKATLGFFHPVNAEDIPAETVLIPYLHKHNSLVNTVTASPDATGVMRSKPFHENLESLDLVNFVKVRNEDGDIEKDYTKIIGDVRGRWIRSPDDIGDSFGTNITNAKAAERDGAIGFTSVVTHALFSDNAIERLDESPITEVVFTDSIYHDPAKFKNRRVKYSQVSVAPLLAEGIRRLHVGESLSEGLYLQPTS